MESAFKKVGILVQLELIKVSDVDQTFVLDFCLTSQWIEPSADDDKQYDVMTQLMEKPTWTPSLQFYGTVGEMTTLLEPSYFRCKNVYYCYYNWIITFKDTLEMERFPFDRQILNVNGFSINSDFIDFMPEYGIPPCVFEEHVNTCIRLKSQKDSWLAENVSLEVSKDGNDSEMEIQLKLTRRPEFYMLNIVLINFLIVTISLTVYTIDAQDFATRISILETNLLTAVAFKFVINAYIPSIPYLTLLDKYMIVTYVILFMIVIVSFIMSLLDADSAGMWNDYFTYVTFSIWMFLHIALVISSHFNLLTPSWEYVEARQIDAGNNLLTLVQKKLRFSDSASETKDVIPDSEEDSHSQRALMSKTKPQNHSFGIFGPRTNKNVVNLGV